MSCIAVIPARGGSKRIPRKNVRYFCGKPMIVWSILAAQESGCFDRIIISTDDDEIANLAHEWNAEVPFKRPANLSDDRAGTIPVMRHAVEWLRSSDGMRDLICCVYATAPFLTPQSLRQGRDRLLAEGCAYAFSVTRYPFPIQRAIRITEDNRVEMFQPEHFCSRSQDLEEAWHDAGQFYWGRASAWLNEESLISRNATPICLPRYAVQDIDTPEDWLYAEKLFRVFHIDSGNQDPANSSVSH